MPIAKVFLSTLLLFLTTMITSPQSAHAVACNFYSRMTTSTKSISNFANSTCVISGVDGVDEASGESSTTNTATINLGSAANITISNGGKFHFGTLVFNGGTLIIQSGGVLKPKTPIYVADSDADGWPDNFTTFYDATASGRRRLSLMQSYSTVDCGASYSATNTCTLANGSACTADANCTSAICGTNADGDTLFSAAAGHTGTCQASALAYTDCDDSNSAIGSKNGTATGGTKSYISGYVVHRFTSGTSTLTMNCGGTTTIEYLVVAGGGGGGGSSGNEVYGSSGGAGGGGGGGVLTSTLSLSQGTGYTATVGGGGAGSGGSCTNARGSSGGNSSFHTVTATGGGGGANGAQFYNCACTKSANCPTNSGYFQSCTTGGSGGGNGYQHAAYGLGTCAGTAGQGNAGGADNGSAPGAGGGGKSAAGAGNGSGGAGGAGLVSSITGSSVTYGVGGQGGVSSVCPSNGTANTGNGGGGLYGGAACSGGAGGSGVVVVRYPNP